MNPVANYAYACLERSLRSTRPVLALLPEEANENGEWAGLGPVWACPQHGYNGHDYHSCPKCQGNYKHWLRQTTSRILGETHDNS